MANNALAPNIDNVLSDYVYAGRKLKEQRTNNMLNPQVQAALNYLKSVGSKFTSLDTPQDMSLGETAADIGLGFVPGIGTAQGARDFERARRENDYLGMGLSAASMLPVVGGVVKAGEKIVPKIATEAIKKGKNIFNVVEKDASEIFGAGAKRIKYIEPQSGSFIDALVKPDGSASVLGLEVPEKYRGKGIGGKLQAQLLNDFPVMGGQVSSKAAATTAYRLGRRPPMQPNATLTDVFNLIDENSSVNMVSPEMQRYFHQ